MPPGDTQICVCSALTETQANLLDGGVSRRSSSEKHLAQPPNALLTRLNLAACSAAFNNFSILNVITERSFSAPARCRLWVERLGLQNRLNTRLARQPRTALSYLWAERIKRER